MRIPWNKGKKGSQIAWNKGLTKKTSRIVRKYSLSSALWRKGRTHTQEHKEKISQSLKGRIPWNVGIPTSENVKKN